MFKELVSPTLIILLEAGHMGHSGGHSKWHIMEVSTPVSSMHSKFFPRILSHSKGFLSSCNKVANPAAMLVLPKPQILAVVEVFCGFIYGRRSN